MNLDETQRSKVAEWIAQGLKLAEIQNRLISELKVTMTYMEVRMLVDDLKLMPKDPEPPKPATPVLPGSVVPPAAGMPSPADRLGAAGSMPAPSAGGPGRVTLSVDQIARPGAVVSGKVTFSDGETAIWMLDQNGRPGLDPDTSGYRPTQEDIIAFQQQLRSLIEKSGL